jgi:hypothetical protein
MLTDREAEEIERGRRGGVSGPVVLKGRATDNIFAERLWRSLKEPSLSHRAVVMGQWYETAEGGNVTWTSRAG